MLETGILGSDFFIFIFIFINLNLWMHLFVTFYKVTARVDVHLGGSSSFKTSLLV